MISTTCELRVSPVQFLERPIAIGPGMVLGYLFMDSYPNLHGASQARFVRAAGKTRTHLRILSPSDNF